MRDPISFQERARDWRRNISMKIIKQLEESAVNDNKEEIGEFLICTAHTKDDQIETMLMKFLRGVHITNFQGVRLYSIFCLYIYIITDFISDSSYYFILYR